MCLGSNRNMWQYTQEDISASTFSNKPQQYISITPITALGCQQCLPLSVVQLKVKHCRKPYCRNGVVDTFGHYCQALYTGFLAPADFSGVVLTCGHFQKIPKKFGSCVFDHTMSMCIFIYFG